MGKRKTKHKKRPKKKLSLATVGGLIGTAAPAIDAAMQGKIQGNGGAIDWLVYRFTGYSLARKQWEWKGLVDGLTPLFAGVMVSKVASWLGVNRRLNLPKIKI